MRRRKVIFLNHPGLSTHMFTVICLVILNDLKISFRESKRNLVKKLIFLYPIISSLLLIIIYHMQNKTFICKSINIVTTVQVSNLYFITVILNKLKNSYQIWNKIITKYYYIPQLSVGEALMQLAQLLVAYKRVHRGQ